MPLFHRLTAVPLILMAALGLAACGTVTGVPSHGGGKRFAVEQELITASARLAVSQIDFSPLAGHSVRVVFSSIGDEGSGNLGGGRLTIDRLLRGDYSTSPTSKTEIDPTGLITRQAITGTSALAGIGILTDGPSGYRSEAFINPRDTDFLSSLVATQLIFAGAQVKANPAAKVEYVVIVLVDVFGTIRDRMDYLIVNNERLRARTSVEIGVVQQDNGAIVLPPRRGAAEATWQENYILWTGPVDTERSLHKLDDLLMPVLPIRPAAGPTYAAQPDEKAAESVTKPVKRKSHVASPGQPATDDVPKSELPAYRRPNLLPKPDTKPRTNPPFQ